MRVSAGDRTVDVPTVSFRDGAVRLIDQRRLPRRFEVLELRTVEEVARAIEDMAVRGAPAIGATAAYGLALAESRGEDLAEAADRLRRTRPTGHDLFAAIDFVLQAVGRGETAAQAAEAFGRDSVERCRKIGELGEPLIRDGARVLTHCNAGALATVDVGTAIAPVRAAHGKGKQLVVYVSETRPRLQGTRLTAWELLQEGIDHRIVADGAAGSLMQRGLVDVVIVGADRIAANGDTANKIGTYEKAVLAREHGIPFYVAAPFTTVDPTLASGRDIPIEERGEGELLSVGDELVSPEGSRALNPAFDVTPAHLITGFITERGILTPEQLRDQLGV